MLRNYLTIAWRNLIRHKVFSMINVIGLAIGMAVSFVLLLYAGYESGYDQFHQKSDQLYQLWNNKATEGKIISSPLSPSPLADKLKQTIPEIRYVARTFERKHWLTVGDHSFKPAGKYTDPDFLQMFSFLMTKGDPGKALQETNSIVLTESLARALFGGQEPMNQQVSFEHSEPMRVTGIIQDVPENSTLQFSFLVPWTFWEKRQAWKSNEEWGYYSFPTFVALRPQASRETVNEKIRLLIGQYAPAESNPTKAVTELFLHPMSQWHLYSDFENGKNVGGRIRYVRLFMGLALSILLIACINFMNLSTARSMKRAREVGIRKVAGAVRFTLIRQFLGETVLFALLALFIAAGIVQFTLPYFNLLFHSSLVISFTNPYYWLLALAVTGITGLMAGSYPAFYLSSFQPIRVLKGHVEVSKTAFRPRQVLVVTQFAFAISLIISTLLIYQQLLYIKNRPIGYQKAGLIQLDLEGSLYENFERFRRETMETGAALNGCATSSYITQANSDSFLEWEAKSLGCDQIITTYHFASTFGIAMKQGRDFSEAFPTDSTAILLNETAVRRMGMKDPIGQLVYWRDEPRRVIGVFDDFVWGSPFEQAKPMAVAFTRNWASTFTLRLNPAQPIALSLKQIEQLYQGFNPGYPFQYKFVDEAFEQKFEFEKQLGTMASLFAGLAVFISCLGLYGLAAFSTEQRRKEMCIRKVLGAHVRHLWFTLSKDFLKLILLSYLIAVPAAYFLMEQWLEQYPFHTPISGWVFGLVGVLVVLIVLLTVSTQTIRAARQNPVKGLRYE